MTHIYINLGAGVVKSVQCLTTDQTTGVQSPADVKDFSSSLCVETTSEAHPASYSMGTMGPLPGVQCSQSMTLTTSSAEVKNE
jgi:hypothetical protein